MQLRPKRTLLLVDSENNHNLIAPHADELLDTPDASSGEFRKKNHAIDVVILEELYVGTHLGDLSWLFVSPLLGT